MKNLLKVGGIILMLAIIGISFSACGHRCDVCGGDGYIDAYGSRIKCTSCGGTGYTN